MRIAIVLAVLIVGFALAGCSLKYDAMGYGQGSPLDRTADIGGSDGPGAAAGGSAGGADGDTSTGI